MTDERKPTSSRRQYSASGKLPHADRRDWDWWEKIERALRDRLALWDEDAWYRVAATDARGSIEATSLAEVREEVDDLSELEDLSLGINSGLRTMAAGDERSAHVWLQRGYRETNAAIKVEGPDEAEVHGILAVLERIGREPLPQPTAETTTASKGAWRDHPWVIAFVVGIFLLILSLIAQRIFL